MGSNFKGKGERKETVIALYIIFVALLIVGIVGLVVPGSNRTVGSFTVIEKGVVDLVTVGYDDGKPSTTGLPSPSVS